MAKGEVSDSADITTVNVKSNAYNGTVKQKNYFRYFSVAPNVYSYFIWTHNLGYNPILMISVERIGAGPNSVFTPYYRILNANQVEIGINNSNNSANFNCNLHWIVIN